MKASVSPNQRVFFREYFLDVGVKLKIHSIIIGELLGHCKINTPSGFKEVRIVMSDDLEVFYVPPFSFFGLN